MENLMTILAFLVFTGFSIRYGLKFIDGRWAWLEQPSLKILKFIIAFCIGYFVIGLYCFTWIWKTLEDLFR